MHRMTLGQVLVLFDAMSAYIVLTNPWGSGDDGAPSAPSTRQADPRERVRVTDPQFLEKFGGSVQNRAPAEMPAHIRALLGV
jgi:hypothetical protein